MALAPTFVSWGLFRGTILGAVSGAVNGTVSVTSLSVGWFSGVDVRGFTIDDPPSGNRVQVDARVEQGLWHVLRSGLSGLDVHVSGAVKTRREADGTISLSRLARTAEPGVEKPAAAPAAGGNGGILPAGLDVRLSVDGINVEVVDPSGAIYAAVRDFKGSAHVAAGGESTAKFTARTELQGTAGALDLDVAAPGIFDAAGALHFKGTPITASIKASDAAFLAGGLGVRVKDATVSVSGKDLTGAVDADVRVAASFEGQPPSAITAKLRFDRLLSATGEPIFDLAAIHGSVRAESVPTTPFQRFVAGTGVELGRDLGPRIDLDTTFADATGGAIELSLRSDAVTLRASGSVDPATRAAMLRTVEADAALAPAMLAAVADLTVSAPARLSLRARDVAIPAVGADGAFPVDRIAFDSTLTLTLAGLQVPGPDGRVPLDISEIRGSLKAAPIADGIALDVSAVSASAAKAAPMHVVAAARLGGVFGAHGSLRVEALPTALVRPFMPRDMAIDVARDVGSSIALIDASLGNGSTPAFALRMESPLVQAELRGTVAADGAVRVEGGSTLTAKAIEPALLAHFGVDVDAPLAASVQLKKLELPGSLGTQLGKIAGDVAVDIGPARRQAPVHLLVGKGADRRSFELGEIRLEAVTAALGEDARVKAQVSFDGMPVKVSVGASNLKDLSQQSIDSAALLADVSIAGISAARVAREVPSAKDILPQVGTGVFDVGVRYQGSLTDGRGTVALTSGPTKLDANVTLTREALAVNAEFATNVEPGLVRAAAPGFAGALAAPAKLGLRVESVSMKRTMPWGFEPPASAKASIRLASATMTGIPGLSGDAAVTDLALDVAVGLGDRMTANGTLAAKLSGRRAGAALQQIAPIDARFGWRAASGTQPAGWDVDAKLDGISGDGLATLIDLDESMRKEIGKDARITAKATSTGERDIAFEVQSTLERLKADLHGQLAGDELIIANSSADITIPGAQATELLNAISAKDDEGGKKKEPAWKQVGAVGVKATLTSVRVNIGGAAVNAAPAPGAPASTAPAPAAVAAKPGIKLPPGTSAVVRLDLRPVTLVPTSGETVVVETVSVAIDAPGLTKPATVKANASISGTGAGAAKFPLALDAKLVDWGSADGSILGDRMRVDGTLKAERASTRVLGALLGMGTELEEAVGPDINVDAAVASTGPGSAVANATVASKYLQMQAPAIRLDAGVISVAAPKPVVVDFIPSEPLRRRYLAAINPIFRDVRLADEKKPIRFTVEAVKYSIDGNRAAMDGDMKLVVGDVLLERNADNAVLNTLKIFQAKDGKPVEGVIDPLVVTIRQGQLKYKDFSVGIERQGKGWVTRLIFDGDIDLTQEPPYARAIAANYPLASVAREVVNVLPNEDGGGNIANVLNTLSLGMADAVQLRIRLRGPLGEVNGQPVKLEQKVKVIFSTKDLGKDVGKTVEGIGEKIGDIFGKKKKKGSNP